MYMSLLINPFSNGRGVRSLLSKGRLGYYAIYVRTHVLSLLLLRQSCSPFVLDTATAVTQVLLKMFFFFILAAPPVKSQSSLSFSNCRLTAVLQVPLSISNLPVFVAIIPVQRLIRQLGAAAAAVSEAI
jgi:hypothetical protein